MRFRLILPAAAGALLLAACEAPTVPGAAVNEVYAYHLNTNPPSILRWPTGSVIRVYLEGGTGARPGVMQGGFDRGAAMWNAAARYGEYELVQAQSLAEADVVLRWSDDLAPVDVSACEPDVSRAVTTFCLSDADPARLYVFPLRDGGASRVRMIVSVLGAEAAVPARAERLIAHELGHVLGIGQHSTNERDIMLPNPDVAVLSPRDAATVRVLYHTRPDITP